MAATKIFPISVTVHKALAYIAAADKTDNGRLISTFMCSRSPDKAANDFADVTARKGIGGRQGVMRKVPERPVPILPCRSQRP